MPVLSTSNPGIQPCWLWDGAGLWLSGSLIQSPIFIHCSGLVFFPFDLEQGILNSKTLSDLPYPLRWASAGPQGLMVEPGSPYNSEHFPHLHFQGVHQPPGLKAPQKDLWL